MTPANLAATGPWFDKTQGELRLHVGDVEEVRRDEGRATAHLRTSLPVSPPPSFATNAPIGHGTEPDRRSGNC